jgi:hypothetical protein
MTHLGFSFFGVGGGQDNSYEKQHSLYYTFHFM